MALSYRTPTEYLINQLPTRLTDNIAVKQVDLIQSDEDCYGSYLNYSLSKDQKKFLVDKGLYLSPYSWKHHSHPACKTIENWLLYKEIGSYAKHVSKQQTIAFVSLREGKLNAIKKIHFEKKNDKVACQKIFSFNRYYHTKDRLRYSDSSGKEIIYKSFDKIGDQIGPRASFYIHDECHYWSPEDLSNFLSRTKAESILATVIHPTEIDVGKDCSHLPFLYEFEVSENNIFFFPDGNRSEGYEQPKTAGWWLKMRRFYSDGEVYSVTLLRTIGPFHLIYVSRGSLASESRRFFDDFNILDLPINYSKNNLIKKMNLLLRKNFMVKIVAYIKSLKKPDKESAIAKLRMLSEEDFSLKEMIFVDGLVDTLLKNGYKGIWENGWVDWFICGLKDCLPDIMHSAMFRSHFKAKQNLDLLMNMKTLSIVIETEDFYPYSKVDCIKVIKDYLFNSNDYQPKDNIDKIVKSSFRGGYLYDYDTSGYYSVNIKKDRMELHGPDFRHVMRSTHDCISYEANIKLFGDDHMEKIRIENRFWFLNDEKRFEAAKKESLSRCKTIFDEYDAILEEELPEDSIFKGFNKGVNFFKKKTMKMRECLIMLRTGLYNKSKLLSNVPHADDPLSMVEKHKRDRLNKVIKYYISGVEYEMPSDQISEIDEIVELAPVERLRSSNPIDEKTFRNLTNKCCFDCIMEIKKMDYVSLINSIMETKFIDLLLKDNGLLQKELIELCNFFDIKVNIIDQSGISLVYDKSHEHTLVLTERHCKLTKTESVSDWFQCENKNFLDLTGVSSIIKNIFDHKRSKKLFESLSKGASGVYFNMIKKKNDESEKKKDKNRVVEMMNFFYEDEENEKKKLAGRAEPVYGFFGFAGSGKSREIQNYINTNYNMDGCVTIISPRVELLKDWERKVSVINKKIRFSTYEKALTLSYYEDELIVVDEIGLLPPGYISLLSLITSMRVDKISHNIRLSKRNYSKYIENQSGRIVLLGDHLQGRYYNESDFRLLSQPDEIDFVMMNEEILYLNYSHRLNKMHFYKPGVEMLGEDDNIVSRRFSNVFSAKKAIPDAQLLVASRDEQVRFKELDAKTFGESQGLTFDEIVIVLSPPAVNCSLNMWNVAMTRARKGVHFALNGFDTVDDFINRVKGTPVNAMILGSPFEIHRTPSGKDKEIKIIKVCRLGMSNEDVEMKLMGDPFLKSIIPSLDEGLSVEQEYHDIVCESPVPKIHLPIESIQGHISYVSSMLKERGEREFKGDGCTSEQFPDFWKTGEPGYFLSQSERFQSIFPKHQNSDSLTFLAAVKKRLKFSSPSIERERFEKVRHLGNEMLDIFLDKVKIDNKINNEMMARSYNEYVLKKVSKTANTIASHSSRSEPDWKLNEIFLFMKTQLCTKYEKRFSDAKAGQTLACFSHIILNRFAAPTRYIEKKVSEGLGEKYYIHQKKNFDVLNDWVVKNGFDSYCLESDYEAFDSSQDCLILAFEYELLKYLGWDQSLLDDYLDLKFNLGCRLGNLAVMRFTGEFGTFLFNTLANMVFTFMTYDLNGTESICFAGDDMCCNKGIKARTDGRYDHILKRLTLKAKAVITREPTFCGWRLTKYGIFKKPELVLERFLIAIEKGRLLDVIDSYYIECSYAYNLGERLFECFSEKDFSAHYCCIRIVHKNKSLLKGLSLEKYRENRRFKHSCKSWTQKPSYTNLTMGEGTSTALESVKCTLMEDSSKTRRLMQFRELKVQFQLSQLTGSPGLLKEYLLLTQMLLMRKGTKRNTQKLTLEQSLLASTSLVIMNVKCQEEDVCWLMVEEVEEVGLSKLLSSTSQKDQPISCSYQMQSLTFMMNYLIEPVRCSSYLTMLITVAVPTHLLLKLGQYIACLMSSIAITEWEFQEEKVPLEVSIRKYTVQKPYQKKMKSQYYQRCTAQEKLEEFLMLREVLALNLKGAREALSCLGEKEALLSFEIIVSERGQVRLKKVYAGLGQAQEVLMKETFLKRFWIVNLGLPVNAESFKVTSGKQAMADQAANLALSNWINETTGFQGEAYGVRLRKLRRRTLLRQHWVSVFKEFVKNIGHANTPAEFTAAENEIYGRIMSDFASYAFGIMAEEGFSPATIYNEVPASYTIEYPQPVGALNVTFSPAEVSRQFKYYANSSTNNCFSNITWRQIGESFAEDIVRYFKELQTDAQSWLVRSNPVLAGNAPWVALDVTDGLDVRRLNPEEKKVIARAKNHLLKSMQLKGRESLSAEALLES